MYKEIVDFIHQLYGSEVIIPLHTPKFAGNEKKYLNECIDSTYVSSVGKFVDRFEEMMEQYTGAKKAVVCVNGTNALHMAMMLVGVEKDDEVITQALTFIATCNAISYIGAHPVFIDVDRDTMGLSPIAMSKWLIENAEVKGNICLNRKTGRRIKACVPMHTFGHPVHLDELVVLCEKYHIELVEDAAESLGRFIRSIIVGFRQLGDLWDKISKNFEDFNKGGGINLGMKDMAIIGAGIGTLIGAFFGPAGMAIGALIGGILGAAVAGVMNIIRGWDNFVLGVKKSWSDIKEYFNSSERWWNILAQKWDDLGNSKFGTIGGQLAHISI
jgi:hypothetical protein